MNKLKMESLDITKANIDKIAELFPQVVTEVAERNGEVDAEGKPLLRKAIDFEKLKVVLSAGTGDYVVADDERERYEFTWVGKRQAMIDAATPIRKTLRPCPEESKDWETTENLYIEGDNLEVLKLLQESYLGKVKMIYIDPPYNTGKDFIYKDKFAQSREEYGEELDMFDEEGNRLFQNTETNGRFHSDWCSMIYPRLQLARNLLTDDGVIFISIDDNEVRNLKNICDEIYGEENFAGTIALQTATDNNPGQIKIEHEYMHCYCKNKNQQNHWFGDLEKTKLIQNKYIQLKNIYKSDLEKIQEELKKWIKTNEKVLKGITHYDNVDERGIFHDGDIANTIFGGYVYDIIHPQTGKICKIPEKGYRFPEETMNQMLLENNVLFGKDETTLPKPKKRLEDAKDMLRSMIYEDGRASTKRFETLMARDIFQNPKSETIISRLVNFICKPYDLVLDFFSGSGTTAEAVLLSASKIIGLKYILVQLPEDLDVSLINADSRAKKTIKNSISFLDTINKPHLITEIGKERIRRAGAKIVSEQQAQNAGLFVDNPKSLDTGFRIFKLDTTNMKDVYYAAGDLSQANLFDMASNIKDDRSDIDLLYGCLLDWGVYEGLQLPHMTEIINGYRVHTVDDKRTDFVDLIACFDEKISEETIRIIAKRRPLRAVFRDSSFQDSADKINVTEIFKALSSDTTVRVI